MSNAGIPTRKRKRSEAHSSPSPSSSPRSPSPRSLSPRSPSAAHPSQQPAQSLPVYPSEEATAQAGIAPAVVASERDHTRPSVSATQIPLPSSANHPSSTKSHSHSQPFVQSWLESSAYGESPDQPASTPASPQPAISQPAPDLVFPLTKFNLRRHCNPTMAGGSKTKASNTISSGQPNNDMRLCELLLINCILKHDPNDVNQFAEIISQGKAIAHNAQVTMSESSAKKAMATRYTYESEPETSFLSFFLVGRVIKLDRRVFDDEQQDYVDKSWQEYGIHGYQDRIFIQTCMKALIKDPSYDKKLHDPSKVMSIPKPDLSYGLYKSTFTIDERSIMENYVDQYQVCSGLVSVFFIVECKAYTNSIDNAELQATRGAAALLCAQRQIDLVAELTFDKDGVDQRSRVFSLSINPNHARLDLHWIRVDCPKPLYYSHRIKTYNLEAEDKVKELRSDIYEIMEWGNTTHRNRVRETIAALRGKPIVDLSPKEDPKDTATTECGDTATTESSKSKKRKGSKA